MAPYHTSLCEQEAMSQDTSINDLFSDDEDDDVFDELPLPTLPFIPVPDLMPASNSLPHLLAQSCGTDDYHDVISVQLKVVASQTSLQRLHIYLPCLQELDLTGSHLQSLRTLGHGLDCLQVLRVGRCALDSLDGLFGVLGLHELYAPHNNISELGLLAILPLLRVLDLQRNTVTNLLQVGFLSLCDKLRELTLAECPVSQLPGYRASVIVTLPRLTQLDGLLLAEGGQDLCQEARQESPDLSDGEDGAAALQIQNLGLEGARKNEPVGIKLQRPATVSGPHRHRATPIAELPARPATALPRRHTEEPVIATPDTVSKLTSGGVVCGNLAAALRGKHRQHKPAWPTQDGDKDGLVCRNGLSVNQLYTEVPPQSKGSGDSHTQSLLVASRHWREAYHSFRSAHREQWKKEEEEEEKEGST